MAKVVGRQIIDEGLEAADVATDSSVFEAEGGKENRDGNKPPTRCDICSWLVTLFRLQKPIFTRSGFMCKAHALIAIVASGKF